jgi:hypothetical protein
MCFLCTEIEISASAYFLYTLFTLASSLALPGATSCTCAHSLESSVSSLAAGTLGTSVAPLVFVEFPASPGSQFRSDRRIYLSPLTHGHSETQ